MYEQEPGEIEALDELDLLEELDWLDELKELIEEVDTARPRL